MPFPLLIVTFISSLAMALQNPGDQVSIAGWNLQSTHAVNSNLTAWSLPHANVSSWYRIGPRATILAGLLESNVYNESDLFYSDHLAGISKANFDVPWLYREEFSLPEFPTDKHLFLKTHGITSKADIFFNGAQIASSDLQIGSYAGHIYDLTSHVLVGQNALLIKAYPTSYRDDFALGWVDWNPHPPDSGTGVWRNVELKLTGPVSISPPRVTTNFTADALRSPVNVTVKTDVVNHGGAPVDVAVQGSIHSTDSTKTIDLSYQIHLPAHSNSTVTLNATIDDPQIWWPATWGTQPLYNVSINASLPSGAISDIAPLTKFGIRHVVSTLSSDDDVAFTVNSHPFQVRGAGYAADIFLRFDLDRLEAIFQYVLDMGLNTIRLEGKQEHPELYDLADRMGLMVIAGWECCDKWEAWSYNEDNPGTLWHDEDYTVAQASMLHEAEMMQPHPSLLAFLVGSDYWPDDRATDLYLTALRSMDWPNPVIASASMRGHPRQLPASGMKMDGPYDWVPPNYWYGDSFGAAFGFGSEQGAGVGTPELFSMRKFLSDSDLKALWSSPNAGQYHLAPKNGVFSTRKIFNNALSKRYGQSKSLEEYVFKSQLMDYEATRAEFEAFAVRQNASRPATGVVYWMLNSAWPSLHWQLFDYYLQPAGAFFGAKVGARQEHVVYDYESKNVYLVNHSLKSRGTRHIVVDLVALNGTRLLHREVTTETAPLASKDILHIPDITTLLKGAVGFLRLILKDDNPSEPLSRNVYWLSGQSDVLDWDKSEWYTTPVTTFANFTALSSMEPFTVAATATVLGDDKSRVSDTLTSVEVNLENQSDVPAFFIRFTIVDSTTHEELAPVFWSDNYVTLFPREKLRLVVKVRAKGGWAVTMRVGVGDERTLKHQ
ncbi:glycoside hydrolase superfamily [Aspergillus pseudoustus]|uniref:Glycoside hydrolase superfamily n=1 Tax=Aspergillus pseudoustus TaxID=1810923 RepID=A0ABR4JPB9_9EURO